MSIETLPVEILHHIFDNLNAQTILLSIRPVCRFFRAIVNTYNRYNLDFQSISKSNFHLLCKLIDPRNVRSLTLYDNEHTPNQIALFISSVRLREFNRLHSIILSGIEELQLIMILKSINLTLLTSFSLNIRKYDDRRRKTTGRFLSLIVTQPNIRKLQLGIKSDRIWYISWPTNCRIEYLTISEDVFFNDLDQILSCSPQLHTLIIKESLMVSHTIKTKVETSSFLQLTSLMMEKLTMTNDQLESFLLLTPSLTYLKLIGENFIFDGKRWEQFIQINLLQLDKFEFFDETNRLVHRTREDFDLIIESFRSPFWVEYKKWFVACEFNMNSLHKVQIYSIPICKSVFRYDINSEKVFLTTSTKSWQNDPLIMNNVNEVIISLKTPININTENEEHSNNTPLSSNAIKLQVDIGGSISLNSFKFIAPLIDVSQLVEVKFESYCFRKKNIELLLDAITTLERSSNNLSSLIIHSRFSKCEMYPYLSRICSSIPRHIKHLQISINRIDQVETIIERCQHLSVVQFEITRTKFSDEVIQWFTEKTMDSAFRKRSGCDTIWIGKRLNMIKTTYKRIKATDDKEPQ